MDIPVMDVRLGGNDNLVPDISASAVALLTSIESG